MSDNLTIPYNYNPYPFQVDLLKARDQGKLLMLTRWHRRAGKDKTFWNLTIKEAAKRKGQYYYLFPEYKQGRRVIWDGMDNDGFSFLDHIPPALRGGIPNQQEMKIKLSNGSIIQIIGTDDYDKIRGSNPVGMVFSEYAYQNPAAYDVASPILLRNGGWAAFNSTPFGKNHFYDMENMLRDEDDAFVQVCTIDDTTDHEGQPLLTAADLDKERRRGKSEEFLLQEYYCFKEDTDIICQDKVKKIKDIKEGDFVLTHTNRFRKVLKTFKREYSGNSIRIKTTGSNKDLICTPNHPFKVCNDGVNNVWKEAKDLTLQDRLVLPRLRKKSLKHITPNLITILGWYITEGSCSKQSVQFTLNINEKEYITNIQKAILDEYNLKSKVYENKGNNSATVVVNSKELVELLSNHCGSGAKNKKIPLDLISSYEEQLYNVLLKGDGHIAYDKYREIYTTISKTLAYQVQLLSNMLGNRAVLREIQQDDYGTILDRVVKLSTKYEVVSYPKTKSDALKNHKYNCSVKIREIEEQVYEDKYVYNIEVQYDNSYVANSRVVHNCDYTANAEGFYFLSQLEALRETRRIGDFAWAPDYPVYTYWDIGVGDSTAIWFVQVYNDTIWLIDFYKATSTGIEHYANVLQNKPYAYKMHVFPHDMINTEFGTGRTRLEMAENIFGADRVDMGPKMGFEDGIQAARAIMPKCKFNEEACKAGIKALENYHREWDDARNEFKQKPVHDWCLSPDTLVRTTSGWKEIKRIKTNDHVFGYSKEQQRIVPTKVLDSNYTRKNAEVIEVLLSNGRSIVCTPDHQFMNNKGEYIEAKDLQINTPLMPFFENLNRKYKRLDLLDGSFADEHRYVYSKYNNEIIPNGYHIDHIDGNRFNNDPDNLVLMSKEDHCSKTFKGVKNQDRHLVDNTPEDCFIIGRNELWLRCRNCGEDYWGSYKTSYCSEGCRKESAKSFGGDGPKFNPLPTLRVRDIRKLEDRIDTYDISTETGNFVAEGVIVHNSSHPSDAFRYLAVGLIYPKEKKRIHDKLRAYRRKFGKKSWKLA